MKRAIRFKRVCNFLAGVLILAACWRLLDPLVTLWNPLWATAHISCNPRCRAQTDPVRLLDQKLWKAAWTQRAEPQLEARLQQTEVRWLLFAQRMTRNLPLFLLFLTLAVAARRFARQGVGGKGLLWLRRSALAALVWVVADPIGRAFGSKALNAAVTGREQIEISIYPSNLLLGLMICGMVWLLVWVIEEALALRTDMEDYV